MNNTAKCDGCRHRWWETLGDVATCNVCEGHELFTPDNSVNPIEVKKAGD